MFNACLYFNFNDNFIMFLLLYVDDILLIGLDFNKLKYMKQHLNCEFDMKDLVNASKILGMNATRNGKKNQLCLDQK